MAEQAKDIPSDVQSLIVELRRGATITIMGGGGHSIGDQINADIGDVTVEQKALRIRLDKHIGQWHRFCRKWAGRERVAALVADMRHWERIKANISPLGHAWFFDLSAFDRMILTTDEIKRRAQERQFRLHRAKISNSTRGNAA